MDKKPHMNELVVCKVIKINPHSVFVELLEYGIEGMIHISEIKRGWIKDIRKHVKLNNIVVAKVINIKKDSISLSIKRVDEKQKNQKLKVYRLEQRAEKILQIAAKGMGAKTKKEIKEKLVNRYGSLYEGFKATLKDGETKKLLGKWFDAIKEVAEKNIGIKEFLLKGILTIKTEQPDGVDKIKSILSSLKSKGLSVKYISAPNYMLSYKTKDPKKGEKKLNEIIEEIKAKNKDVLVEFKRSS